MAKILCRTKGNSSPKGKPRVFFTCHPEDFDKYFDKICEDIFASQNCAIYYTEDMTELIEEQNLATDLESNNLLVIPVTFKLLTTPNRAMDFDVQFAKEKHIPILPFLMEPGLDFWYSKQDKFGEMQYINPYSTDLTAISYEEKLKKYLGTVLVDDETAKRVRGAFDAYIFLSYRKKDRHLANKLMRMIHSNPEYRDIAIWFDEFLTPGESFRENISKALAGSKLFTLLVTPNLLEENNFVMREEYPAAVASGIEILPAEMEKTDRETLEAKYEGIPECAVTEDEIAFRNRLLEEAARLSNPSNDTPEHNYLIGLAYLEGIDVEVDRERGLELITSAAEAEHPGAMLKLYSIYQEGLYVKLDYGKSLYWIKKLTDYYIKEHGEEHEASIYALTIMAVAFIQVGEYGKALELCETVYALLCKVFGEDHPRTLLSLNNLAYAYGDVGEYEKSLELNEKVYAIRCRVLGEEHPDTLTSLNNLASAYGKVGEYAKKLELNEKVYALRCRVLGEEHPDTLTSLNNLASAYGEVGEYEKSLELCEKVYAVRCRMLGKDHPDTLLSLNNLSYAYGEVGEYAKSLDLYKKVYSLLCRVLGEEHPNTLTALNNLAGAYGKVGEYAKSLDLYKKVYSLRCRVLGEEHPDTLRSLNNLADAYGKAGEYAKSLELYKKVYTIQFRVLGEKHPDTLNSLSNLASAYDDVGEYAKSLELYEKVYALSCKVNGEDDTQTIEIKKIIDLKIKLADKTLELYEGFQELYSIQKKKLGKKHSDTLKTKSEMENLEIKLQEMGKLKKRWQGKQKLFCKIKNWFKK